MSDTQQPPFEGENIQSAEIVPMNRVQAMAKIAEQEFEKYFSECGGEEYLKELQKKARAALKLPIDDVSTAKTVNDARMKFVKVRTALDEIRKGVKRDIIDAGKAVEDVHDLFLNKFKPTEDKLAEYKSKIDAAKKEKEEAESRAKEELKRTRIAKVEEAGAKFTGQWWAINDISIGAQMLEEMPDDLFGDLLGKIKVQYDLNEAARIAKEKAEQEEREALEAEKERQRKMQEELELEREKMRKEREEIEAEKERILKEKEEAEAAKAKQEREAEEARIKAELEAKITPYLKIGYERRGEVVVYAKGHFMTSFSINDLPPIDEAFKSATSLDAEFEKWTQDQIKGARFNERVRQIMEIGFEKNDNAYTNRAIEVTYLDSVILDESDDNWFNFVQDCRMKLIAIQEKERQSALDDKQKVYEWLVSLVAIESPEVKDKEMKAIIGGVCDFISDNIEKLGLA